MICSKLSFFAVVSLLSVSAAACGGPPEGAASPASPAAAPSAAAPAVAAPAVVVKEAGDAKVGDTAKCPVSGETFVVEASSPKTEHDGKTYFFCCGGCKKKFEAEPAKYLKKA